MKLSCHLLSGSISKIRQLSIFVYFSFVCVPASATVFNVNTTDDTHALVPLLGLGLDANGNISLRSALETIDAVGGSHTINLPAGVYLITEGVIYFGSISQTVAIQGAGAATTIIEMSTGVNQDRIFLINPFADIADVSVTINGVKFKNGHLNTDPYGGGAIRAGGPNNLLRINNCIFENNTLDAINGGTTGGAINISGGGDLFIDNSTFTGNTNPVSDGGAVYYFLQNFPGLTGSVTITNSTFSGNSADASGAGNGGAIAFSAAGEDPGGQSFSVSIQKNTFLNNSAPGGTGGAISGNTTFGTGATVNINYNRFVGNTSSNLSTSALSKFNGDGNINATNNWWGCNTGPVAAGACDKAADVSISGTGLLTTSPWLQLKADADPDKICPGSLGNSTTVTAGFLSNSNNDPVSASDLSALVGLPISFVNPVLGTLSGAQTTIQPSGTATVLFTLNSSSGTGSVNAVVDNVPGDDPVAKATIILDEDDPVIYCPAPVSFQCASEVPAADPSSVVASDNSGNAPVVTWEGDVISNQSCANNYTIARTYMATDACGNTAACTQVITVNDDTDPIISCPAAINVKCASAVPAPDITGVTASDNCGQVTVSWQSDVPSNQVCANNYTITRTYRATDACGNFTECTQTITVNDDENPVITCPAALTVQCSSEVPAHDFAGGTASDNCGTVNVAWVSDVVSNQTCANRYTITRTYKATDACGNEASCTQTITVNDNIAPTITCPGPVTVQCAADIPAHDFAGGSASDNCGTPTVTWVSDVISNQTCANRYTITRTYTADDGCGNNTTCSQTITVNDNTAPVVTAGTIAGCYPTTEAAEAAALSNTVSSDNCSGALTITASSSGSCSATIVVTATDVCGNAASVSYSTRIDNTAPIVSAGTIASCYPTAAAAQAAAISATTATDNCPENVTKTSTISGTCSAVVTVTVSDGCGNLSSVSYNTRVDNTAPTLSSGTIASCYPTAAAAETAAINATSATDNCPGTITKTASTSGTCNATVTVTATDACGNQSTVSYNTRIDNTPPVLNCPNVEANPTSMSGAIVNYAEPTATDNCGLATVTYVSGGTSGSLFPIGSTNVTYQAMDECGNMSTCTFTVTVKNPSCGTDKVYVCHEGNTICISTNALATHEGHGDLLGPCEWHNFSKISTTTGEDVKEISIEKETKSEKSKSSNPVIAAPESYKVTSFPNPFSDKTTIRFELPADSKVSITVFDLTGKQVATILSADRKAGVYTETFNAGHLTAGIYYYKFIATAKGKQYIQTEKLSVLK